jgi:hypothetical protein
MPLNGSTNIISSCKYNFTENIFRALNTILRAIQRDPPPPQTHKMQSIQFCVWRIFLDMKRLGAVNFTKQLTLRQRLSETS